MSESFVRQGISAGTQTPGAEPEGSSLPRRPSVLSEKVRSLALYVSRRVAEGCITIVGVSVLVFIITRVFTDPVSSLLPVGAPRHEYNALSRELGFDRPLTVQFREFLWNLVRFRFGNSISQAKPAGPIVFSHLWATSELVIVAVTFAAVVGISAGLVAAMRPMGILDRLIQWISLISVSLPAFWLGALLIALFAVHLGWFPASGGGNLSYLVLPAATLAIPILGRILQVTRTAIGDELSSRYVVVASTKGLSAWYIVLRHCLRNALVAITSIVSLELIRSFSAYIILVEVVFSWPGIGELLLQALGNSDVFLIQALVFVIAVLVVVINLLADVIQAVIDPRILTR
jgi:peptide/nickel transport system permease protein